MLQKPSWGMQLHGPHPHISQPAPLNSIQGPLRAVARHRLTSHLVHLQLFRSTFMSKWEHGIYFEAGRTYFLSPEGSPETSQTEPAVRCGERLRDWQQEGAGNEELDFQIQEHCRCIRDGRSRNLLLAATLRAVDHYTEGQPTSSVFKRWASAQRGVGGITAPDRRH